MGDEQQKDGYTQEEKIEIYESIKMHMEMVSSSGFMEAKIKGTRAAHEDDEDEMLYWAGYTLAMKLTGKLFGDGYCVGEYEHELRSQYYSILKVDGLSHRTRVGFQDGVNYLLEQLQSMKPKGAK